MYVFQYDKRLQLTIPVFDGFWEELSLADREAIVYRWEQSRSTIPDRIAEIEQKILIKQNRLSLEEDFNKSCHINSEIAELASIITDLWIWYRKHLTTCMA